MQRHHSAPEPAELRIHGLGSIKKPKPWPMESRCRFICQAVCRKGIEKVANSSYCNLSYCWISAVVLSRVRNMLIFIFRKSIGCLNLESTASFPKSPALLKLILLP